MYLRKFTFIYAYSIDNPRMDVVVSYMKTQYRCDRKEISEVIVMKAVYRYEKDP